MINSTPNFKFENTALISDGLKIQETVNKSIIVVDNNNYYSEGLLNLILKNKLSYDPNQNAVFYNPKGKKVASETKVDLFDTEVLYDGSCFAVSFDSRIKSDVFAKVASGVFAANGIKVEI